ncbi:MAG: MarR family transcriptional regulator [Sulfurimonas sp.]|nr:MarR family transcriptional regulator [Sulfurimonas sp.]
MNFNMDQSLGFLLNKTALLSKAAFHQKLKEFDISPEQWALIFRVVQKNGLTQKELSDSTYKDQANITRSVYRLEHKGILQRVRNAKDKRIINIFPTPLAEEIVQKVIPLSSEHNKKLAKGLSKEEHQLLLDLLHKVEHNLENGETK